MSRKYQVSIFTSQLGDRTDLTNLLEAVDDLLVSEGIIEDDHYGIVTAHDGSRCYWDKESPRTEIIITKMLADGQMKLF